MGEYDKSSKWLFQHHADSILRLAGVEDIVEWKPLQAELIQPTQLPDGIIEVHRAGADRPNLFIVEVATYPERRVYEQLIRDTMLVYLDRHELPEVIVLVLHPKGNIRIDVACEFESPLRWTGMRFQWRTIELWSLRADDLLATNDPGLIPWVPLTDFSEAPEHIFRRCRERIEKDAPAGERQNLLAVTQVLARLRFDESKLLSLLGGTLVMIESPLIQELLAEQRQKDVLQVLEARHGTVAEDISNSLAKVIDDQLLDELLDTAANCPDLDSFRSHLPK